MKIKNLNNMGKCSKFGISWTCDSDNYNNGTIRIHYKYKYILEFKRHDQFSPKITNGIMKLLEGKHTKKELLNKINLLIIES